MGATRGLAHREISVPPIQTPGLSALREGLPRYHPRMRTENDPWKSSETGEAFSHCVRCRMPLVEIGSPWLVNKDFHRGECVLEYAICQGCRDEVTESLSESSKQEVRRFLETEIDWEARIAGFMSSRDPLDRLRTCVACSTPAAEADGYAISALFDEGGRIVTRPLPLLLCRCCIDRLLEHLSDESQEVWRQFLGDCFDGPPPADGKAGFGFF